MMTPTRKSGRQPKPSARMKEYLYDSEVEKMRGPVPKEPPKKKESQQTKSPASKDPPKKKELQQNKSPVSKAPPKKKVLPQTKSTTKGPRMIEKKIADTPIKKEIPDSGAPARKSGRTPKPSAKLQEYLCDEKEKSNDSFTFKKSPRDLDKPKKNIKIKEEIKDEDFSESEGDESDTDDTKPSEKETKKPTNEKSPSKPIKNRMTTQELLRKQMMGSGNLSRARVTSLTSIAAKKEKNLSRLTVRKGKIYTTSPVSGSKTKKSQSKPVLKEKTKKVLPSGIKRKREPETTPTVANKKFIKTKDPSKLFERAKRSLNNGKTGMKENACKVEKKEIERVLQVNKEVMTQLLNFGAEVAEAMACNNESIFSFSSKDNPLETFKIDKQQEDFSDEEVVKIIKWFEEEEEQRRSYRKRILEALRASHETNMSLYTQMLKMLQSVTAC